MVVDDSQSFLDLFLALPECDDFEVAAFTSAAEGLSFLEANRVDLIVSDVQMPGMDGNAFFQRVQDTHPEIPVILITAFGSTDKAVQAVKQGAFYYFEKPLHGHLDLFWTTVRQALIQRDNLREIAAWRRQTTRHPPGTTQLIGQSAAIRRVRQAIAEVAELPTTILITGETGTGKELVARALHGLSSRREKPFLAVNCAEFAPECSKANSSDTNAALLPAPWTKKKDCLKSPVTVPSFSMKSVKPPCPCRPNCCACWKTGISSAWAAVSCWVPTAGWLSPPIVVFGPRWPQDVFGRIFTTASNIYGIDIAPIAPPARGYRPHRPGLPAAFQYRLQPQD